MIGEAACETPEVKRADNVEDSGRAAGAEGAWLTIPAASAEAADGEELVSPSPPCDGLSVRTLAPTPQLPVAHTAKPALAVKSHFYREICCDA